MHYNYINYLIGRIFNKDIIARVVKGDGLMKLGEATIVNFNTDDLHRSSPLLVRHKRSLWCRSRLLLGFRSFKLIKVAFIRRRDLALRLARGLTILVLEVCDFFFFTTSFFFFEAGVDEETGPYRFTLPFIGGGVPLLHFLFNSPLFRYLKEG